MDEIKSALLERYVSTLKKYRAAVGGRQCTSTRDFLHGRISEARETMLIIFGNDIREDIRKAEGD